MLYQAVIPVMHLLVDLSEGPFFNMAGMPERAP